MKTVLITGASSGFGAMMVEKFALEGWFVYATARDLSKEGVKSLTKLAVDKDLDIEWIKLDVTKDEDVKSAYKRVVDNGRGLDLLINNAGYGLIGPLETFTMSQIKDQFDVNYFGVVNMIQTFLPMMREQKSGRIINLSSIAGLISVPMYGAYSSSKFALESMSEALRNEVKQFGISVSLIEPGSFDTKFGENVKGRDVDENSVYKEVLDKLVGARNQFHDHPILGMLRGRRDPMVVVNAVYKVANIKKPPLRTIVGIDAKLEYFLRRLLPSSTWDWFVSIFVGRR